MNFPENVSSKNVSLYADKRLNTKFKRQLLKTCLKQLTQIQSSEQNDEVKSKK